MPKVPSSVPNPAEFPLGSLQSRAAPRAWVNEVEQTRARMSIPWFGLGPGEQPSIGECPHPTQDGTIVAIVHLPTGYLVRPRPW